MLCHNNAAERPFAVLRQYKRLYSFLSIANLAKLTDSLDNGTHRPGSSEFKAGVALTADPRLRNAIEMLCSVKRKTVLFYSLYSSLAPFIILTPKPFCPPTIQPQR
jgi:hypothetical protein